eukprot:6266150-Amphidinium_carterae.2
MVNYTRVRRKPWTWTPWAGDAASLVLITVKDNGVAVYGSTPLHHSISAMGVLEAHKQDHATYSAHRNYY